MASAKDRTGRRINVWAIAAVVGLVLILALIGIRLLQNDASAVQIGEKTKNFSLSTFDGTQIHTADLRGQVVLINFWASWCTTCDGEAALLEAAWQHYQVEQPGRVMFLGVAYMDTDPASRAYLEQLGISYPTGPDLRGELSRAFRVNSVPETFVLDAEGTLRHLKIGPFASINEILSTVDSTLLLSIGSSQ